MAVTVGAGPALAKYYSGLSTDTKPTGTNVYPGDSFWESDTNVFYVWNGTAWITRGQTGVTFANLTAGENPTLDLQRVSSALQYVNITTGTTTVIKSGAGMLGKLIINKAVLATTITIYDNTAGSGSKIGTITYGAALLSDPPLTAHYEVMFGTGLTIVTSGATDLTVGFL